MNNSLFGIEDEQDNDPRKGQGQPQSEPKSDFGYNVYSYVSQFEKMAPFVGTTYSEFQDRHATEGDYAKLYMAVQNLSVEKAPGFDIGEMETFFENMGKSSGYVPPVAGKTQDTSVSSGLNYGEIVSDDGTFAPDTVIQDGKIVDLKPKLDEDGGSEIGMEPMKVMKISPNSGKSEAIGIAMKKGLISEENGGLVFNEKVIAENSQWAKNNFDDVLSERKLALSNKSLANTGLEYQQRLMKKFIDNGYGTRNAMLLANKLNNEAIASAKASLLYNNTDDEWKPESVDWTSINKNDEWKPDSDYKYGLNPGQAEFNAAKSAAPVTNQPKAAFNQIYRDELDRQIVRSYWKTRMKSDPSGMKEYQKFSSLLLNKDLSPEEESFFMTTRVNAYASYTEMIASKMSEVSSSINWEKFRETKDQLSGLVTSMNDLYKAIEKDGMNQSDPRIQEYIKKEQEFNMLTGVLSATGMTEDKINMMNSLTNARDVITNRGLKVMENMALYYPDLAKKIQDDKEVQFRQSTLYAESLASAGTNNSAAAYVLWENVGRPIVQPWRNLVANTLKAPGRLDNMMPGGNSTYTPFDALSDWANEYSNVGWSGPSGSALNESLFDIKEMPSGETEWNFNVAKLPAAFVEGMSQLVMFAAAGSIAGPTGIVTTATIQEHDALYEEASAAGLSDAQASAFAFSTGALIGLSELIVRDDKLLMGGADVLKKGFTKAAIEQLLKGRTQGEAIAFAARQSGLLGLKEGAIEEQLNYITELASKASWNIVSGSQLFDSNYDLARGAEATTIGFLVGMAGGGARGLHDTSPLRRQIAYNAAVDLDKTIEQINSQEDILPQDKQRLEQFVRDYRSIVDSQSEEIQKLTPEERAVHAAIEYDLKQYDESEAIVNKNNTLIDSKKVKRIVALKTYEAIAKYKTGQELSEDEIALVVSFEESMKSISRQFANKSEEETVDDDGFFSQETEDGTIDPLSFNILGKRFEVVDRENPESSFKFEGDKLLYAELVSESGKVVRFKSPNVASTIYKQAILGVTTETAKTTKEEPATDPVVENVVVNESTEPAPAAEEAPATTEELKTEPAPASEEAPATTEELKTEPAPAAEEKTASEKAKDSVDVSEAVIDKIASKVARGKRLTKSESAIYDTLAPAINNKAKEYLENGVIEKAATKVESKKKNKAEAAKEVSKDVAIAEVSDVVFAITGEVVEVSETEPAPAEKTKPAESKQEPVEATPQRQDSSIVDDLLKNDNKKSRDAVNKAFEGLSIEDARTKLGAGKGPRSIQGLIKDAAKKGMTSQQIFDKLTTEEVVEEENISTLDDVINEDSGPVQEEPTGPVSPLPKFMQDTIAKVNQMFDGNDKMTVDEAEFVKIYELLQTPTPENIIAAKQILNRQLPILSNDTSKGEQSNKAVAMNGDRARIRNSAIADIQRAKSSRKGVSEAAMAREAFLADKSGEFAISEGKKKITQGKETIATSRDELGFMGPLSSGIRGSAQMVAGAVMILRGAKKKANTLSDFKKKFPAEYDDIVDLSEKFDINPVVFFNYLKDRADSKQSQRSSVLRNKKLTEDQESAFQLVLSSVIAESFRNISNSDLRVKDIIESLDEASIIYGLVGLSQTKLSVIDMLPVATKMKDLADSFVKDSRLGMTADQMVTAMEQLIFDSGKRQTQKVDNEFQRLSTTISNLRSTVQDLRNKRANVEQIRSSLGDFIKNQVDQKTLSNMDRIDFQVIQTLLANVKTDKQAYNAAVEIAFRVMLSDSRAMLSDFKKNLSRSFVTYQNGVKKGKGVDAETAELIEQIAAEAGIKKSSKHQAQTATSLSNRITGLYQSYWNAQTTAERKAINEQIQASTIAFAVISVSEAISSKSSHPIVNGVRDTSLMANTMSEAIMAMNTLNDIITNGRDALNQEINDRSVLYESLVIDALEDLKRPDGSVRTRNFKPDSNKRKFRSAVLKKKSWFLTHQYDVNNILDKISYNTRFLSKLGDDVLQRGEFNFIERMHEIDNMVIGAYKNFFGKNWKSQIYRLRSMRPIVLDGFGNYAINPARNNQPLVLSQFEAMYLYNQWQDESQRINIAATFNIDSTLSADDQISEAAIIMNRIEANLDPRIKAYAEWKRNVLYPTIMNDVAPKYREIFRTNLGIVDNYAGPARKENVSTEDVSNLFHPTYWNSVRQSPNSVKERIANRQALKIVDDELNMKGYITDMTWFTNMADSYIFLDKIFNNQKVKDALESNNLENEGDMMRTLIGKIANRFIEPGDNYKIVDKLNSAMAVKSLALSYVPAIKQVVSAFIAASRNPSGITDYMVTATQIASNPKRLYELIDILNPLSNGGLAFLKDRYNNDYLMEVIAQAGNFRAMEVKRGAKFDHINGKVVNLMMSHIKVADFFGVMGGIPIYESVYKKEIARHGNHDEAHKEASFQFTLATKKLQQSKSGLDKDVLQLQSGTRWLGLFQGAGRQQWREAMGAYAELARAMKGLPTRSSVGQNIFKLLSIRVFMPVAMSIIASGFTGLWDDDDDDERRSKKNLEETKGSAKSAVILGNTGSLAIVGNLLQAALDAGFEREYAQFNLTASESLPNEILDRIVRMARGNKDYKNFLKIADLVFPASNADRMIRNYSELDPDNGLHENFLRLMNYSDYQVNKVADKKIESKTRRSRGISFSGR